MSADGGDKRPVDPAAPVKTGGRPPEPAPAPEPKRSNRRYYIMAAVPVVLILIGGYFWLTGGRYASTDNAYVQQDRVTITADVSGRIVKVAAGANQAVKKGDLLLEIDPEPYKIALAQADAAVATARLSVDQLRSSYQQALVEQKTSTDDLDFKQKAFDRQQDLLGKGIASQATYEQAENDLHTAQQTLAKDNEGVQAALAALGGDATIKTDDHPTVLAALAKRDQAALDLKNTDVLRRWTAWWRRPARCRWAATWRARRPTRRRCSASSRPAAPGSRRTSRRPTSPACSPARRRRFRSTLTPATSSPRWWPASVPAPARSSPCCRRRTPAATG